MYGMQRACATLLLALFSFLLGAPVLFADADANLPACCRRLGRHHCAMPSEQTSAPAVKSAPCSFFPSVTSTPVPTSVGLVKFAGGVSGPPTVHAVSRIPVETGLPGATRDLHPKRGPPQPLV